MVCCTTLWWDCAGKGRGWKTAAIIYCWQQQRVRGRTAQLSDISSGATCVADLDSRALALTKEASGNSRAPPPPPPPHTHKTTTATTTTKITTKDYQQHQTQQEKKKYIYKQNISCSLFLSFSFFFLLFVERGVGGVTKCSQASWLVVFALHVAD